MIGEIMHLSDGRDCVDQLLDLLSGESDCKVDALVNMACRQIIQDTRPTRPEDKADLEATICMIRRAARMAIRRPLPTFPASNLPGKHQVEEDFKELTTLLFERLETLYRNTISTHEENDNGIVDAEWQ